MNTTTYIRYAEPTVRNNLSQAYSQCLPEPDYGYAQQPNYGYSPEPQNASLLRRLRRRPAAADPGSGAGRTILVRQQGPVVHRGPGRHRRRSVRRRAADELERRPHNRDGIHQRGFGHGPAGTPVVNLPSAIDIPALAPAQNAPAPVIVNNQAPVVRVAGPTVSKPIVAPAPKLASAPAPKLAPAPAAVPAPAPAPVPAPAPGPNGVTIKAPGVEVGADGQGGVAVKTPRRTGRRPRSGQGRQR